MQGSGVSPSLGAMTERQTNPPPSDAGNRNWLQAK
jgi:hypothetical protein